MDDNELLQKISDLEAEVASLKSELNEKNVSHETLKKELQKTKEMNYTLTRRLDVSRETETPEAAIVKMFGRRDR